MCTASINAEHTRNATTHDDLTLVTDQSDQPYFHRVGDDMDLVTCVANGTRVSIAGLSPRLCDKLDVPPNFNGTFAQDPTDQFDAIWLECGRFVSLPELCMEGDAQSGALPERRFFL